MPKREEVESMAPAQQVVHYCEKDGTTLASATDKHLKAIGISKTTVRNMSNRYVDEGRTQRMKGGRKMTKKSMPTVVHLVRRLFETMPMMKLRTAARVLHLPSSAVSQIKAGILVIMAHRGSLALKDVNDKAERAKR